MNTKRALQAAGAALVLVGLLAPKSAEAAPQAGVRGSNDSTTVCSPISATAAIKPNSYLLNEAKYGAAPVLVYPAWEERLLNEAKYGAAPALSGQEPAASASSARACGQVTSVASQSQSDARLDLEWKYGG